MGTYVDALRAERANLLAQGKTERVAQIDAQLSALDAGVAVVDVRAELAPTEIDTTAADHSEASAAVVRRGRGRVKD